MKMKKKVTMLMALSLALVLVLAACSSGNGNSNGNGNQGGAGNTSASGSEANSTPSEPIKLVMWGGVPPEAGPQQAIDNWNSENPNIQVEYIRYVNDDAGNLKLDSALLTGQEADLYVNYNLQNLEKRVSAGTALDLSTFGDYDIDGKMGEFASSWKIDDTYYALPTKKTINFIWINKNALDEAGLDVPQEWTLETLREYARALTTEGRYGFVTHDWMIPNQMDGILQSEYTVDGQSRFDHPAVKQSLQVYYDMMHVDKSMPTLGEQLATKMDVTTMFLNGEAAMMGAGDWIFRSASNLTDFPRDFVIATAPLPSLAGYEDAFAVEGGLGDAITINARSQHTEAAWEFLKWYADGGMTPLIAGGRVPSSSELNQEEAIATMIRGVESLYDESSIQNTMFGERKEYQITIEKKIQDIRKEEMERYFLQDQDLDQTVNNLVTRHNAELG